MTPSLPRLSYVITRNYPWSTFTPGMVVLTVLGLMVLIPLNFALTGYQYILSFSNNHDEVPFNWWNHLAPLPKAGSLCRPQNFTAGQSLTTTYGAFQWSILSPNSTNSSVSYIPYAGSSLDSCDIVLLGIDANAIIPTIGLSAVVQCNSTDLPILMETSWTPWGSTSSSFTQAFKHESNLAAANYTYDGGDEINEVLLYAASLDLFRAMVLSYNRGGNSTYSFILNYQPRNYCPKIYLDSEINNCTRSSTYGKVDFPDDDRFVQLGLGRTTNTRLNIVGDPAAIGNDDTVNNLFQVMHACVRLDLGYVLPNNILTNASMLAGTIVNVTTLHDDIGDGSAIYDVLQNPKDNGIVYPISFQNETFFDVSYQCTFKHRKSWAEVAISVFVATFTLFSSGWGVAMVIASYFATKEPDAKACIAHVPQSFIMRDQSGAGTITQDIERPLSYIGEKES